MYDCYPSLSFKFSLNSSRAVVTQYESFATTVVQRYNVLITFRNISNMAGLIRCKQMPCGVQKLNKPWFLDETMQ
mgnify:CR=1 FL=1